MTHLHNLHNRTVNTMITAKNGQTIYKTLHSKLKIDQDGPTKTGVEPWFSGE
jgi:hypothetical protein